MRAEILRMDDVTCRRSGVNQLRHFNLQVYCGEIMGLMAINAHGVETLLSLLQDNTPIHFGRVYYQEKLVNSHIYSRSAPNRLAIVEKQSRLIEGLSVGENIFVFSGTQQPWIVHTQSFRERLRVLEETAGIELPHNCPVELLSFFERCVVELLKADVSGAQMIVLREISHYMTGAELAKIHQVIRRFASTGTAFLYVSSSCEELAAVCDRMAVMHNGEVVKVLEQKQMTQQTINGLLRGLADVSFSSAKNPPSSAPVQFALRGVCSGSFRDLELEVRAGECLVIHDEDASFIAGFKRLVTGQEPVRAGQILLGGQWVRKPLVRCRQFAYIAENPASSMLFHDMNGIGNLSFGVRAGPLRRTAIGRSLRQELAGPLGGIFDKNPDELSVPEQYSLMFYRVLLQRPQIVFCEQPFWGSDMYLRQHIVRLVQMLLDHTISVVVMTAGLFDIFPAANRVIICNQGKLAAYPKPPDAI